LEGGAGKPSHVVKVQFERVGNTAVEQILHAIQSEWVTA